MWGWIIFILIALASPSLAVIVVFGWLVIGVIGLIMKGTGKIR